MSRLVNVSNRVALPSGTPSPGGLAVGIMAAMHARGGLWFGWNGEISDGAPQPPAITVRDGVTFATIALTKELFQDYYSGFSNGTLWPLFHYFLGGFRYEDRELAAYHEANERFARALEPLLQPADLIWVHDYHLVPLGEKLRAMGVRQPVGFFLHIPFPHFEVLRALPGFADLVRALLAYDLVGFQTEIDRGCFLGAVRGVFGAAAVSAAGGVTLGTRTVRTEVFPIGVDVAGIAKTAARAVASAPVQRLVGTLLRRRLIVGVDRLDHSKGLLERFKAYRRFLEDYPDQIGKVTYLQIAPLGRQNVPAYAEIRDALEQSSGRTNGRFADADWTPIRYLNRNFPHGTLMGFLRAAQVCLVTPVRDGMNLVAKEFLAAQDRNDPGVLILSDRAGAACELNEALLVNPYDARGVAQALRQALAMPLLERQARHETLLARLRENDIHEWSRRFIEELRDSGPLAMRPPRTPRGELQSDPVVGIPRAARSRAKNQARDSAPSDATCAPADA